jgi:hypothetical protein
VLPLIECAVVSAVILATAVAMFVLFRYDPEGSASEAPVQRRAAQLAIRAEFGKMSAFLTRISAYRSTRAAAATLAAVAFGLLEDASHEVVIGLQVHPALKAMGDGFIVAVCGGALVWLMLTAVSRRVRHSVSQQNDASAVGTDIDEALQHIVEATPACSAKEREAIICNVERIEAAMRRMNGERTETPRAGREELIRAQFATSSH